MPALGLVLSHCTGPKTEHSLGKFSVFTLEPRTIQSLQFCENAFPLAQLNTALLCPLLQLVAFGNKRQVTCPGRLPILPAAKADHSCLWATVLLLFYSPTNVKKQCQIAATEAGLDCSVVSAALSS